MNNAQTIFTIFYGVYFAVTVQLTGIFRPFDTPEMYKRNGYAWWRFIFSFFTLNFLPLSYFVLIFNWLSKWESFSVDIWHMLGLLVLSLAGFGFYRIYWGVMLTKRGESFFFYGKNLPLALKEELDKRDKSHQEVKPHLVPGLFWVITSISLGYVITQ